MKRVLGILFFGCSLVAQAHIGSPNVFLEDKAGEYPVRVVIRPPAVVPGLAEISVRVQQPVERVTVLPVFWKAGREGSPAPDEARLVRGETNLYTAELWLMKPGAYSVDVTVEGPRGKGTLIVPVNSMATNTRPMTRGYAAMLWSLAAILFLGGMKIAGAFFGESRLEPGATLTRKVRWQSRVAMLLAACGMFGLMFLGKKWWDSEDRSYRNNALYKPTPVAANVRAERDQFILELGIDAAERRGRWTPLIPDHGKLMHVFLVRDAEADAFAHLHPVQRSSEKFEAPLPPLPAGKYHVYADVTHENGFSETLVASAEISAASLAMKRLWLGNSDEPICSTTVVEMLATNLAFAPDPDDSWQTGRGSVRDAKTEQPLIADVGGGYRMIWETSGPLVKNLDTSLRFKLLTKDQQPARIEPYMGMLGHAVVRRQDGGVFAHVHPVGTFSMAARDFFVHGKPRETSAKGKLAATSVAQSVETARLHGTHDQAGVVGEISFPYAFPESGNYRLWVQMKTSGRILTGVFDTMVLAEQQK